MNKKSLFDEPVSTEIRSSKPSASADCGCRHTLRQAEVPEHSSADMKSDAVVSPTQIDYCVSQGTQGRPTVPATQPGSLAPEATLEPSALYEYLDNDYGEVAACWYDEGADPCQTDPVHILADTTTSVPFDGQKTAVTKSDLPKGEVAADEVPAEEALGTDEPSDKAMQAPLKPQPVPTVLETASSTQPV